MTKTSINFAEFSHLHLVGSGGIGMLGLKNWLNSAKYYITCSDDAEENPSNIPEELPVDADCLVISSAIKNDHPQCSYARENRIPILHRSTCVKYLMSSNSISVSGAHGKTTSSAILAYVLNKYYRNTSFLVGGILKNLGTSAQLKPDGWCVVEADESDDSMNRMSGQYHLLTNLAEEHIDYYKTFENYLNRMNHFANACQILVCHESCRPHITRADVIYYDNDKIYISNVSVSETKTTFDAVGPWGEYKNLHIRIPGEQFAMNALGCLTILHSIGVNEEQIRDGFGSFIGVEKRMDIIKHEGLTLIADYAVHPTEVEMVIRAARKIYPNKKLSIIWEPHRFSRLRYKDNLPRFIHILSDNVETAVLPIWAASEEVDEELSGEKLAEILKGKYLSNLDDIIKYIECNSSENKAVIAFGAGQVHKMVKKAVQIIKDE